MLATILSGTDADDILRIEFTDDPQLVQVRLNDEPQQLIEVTDLELRIDLRQGNDVVIFENVQNNSDELTRILIQSAETIQASDSDNHWQVFDRAFSSIDGVLNDHIEFEEATELIGGAERDEFRIRSFGRGSIHGGAGNDLFVFGRDFESNFGVVHGGEGDDQFIVRGSNILEIRGGEGNDRLSLRNSELSAIHVVAEVRDEITWQFQNQSVDVDRIIGLSTGPNRVEFVIADGLTGPVQQNETGWVINGSIARSLIDSDVTTFVNFRRFEFLSEFRDSVFVRSTAYNLTLDGPDFLQLSSELDPALGNLDQINHRVTALAPLVDFGGSAPRIVVSQQNGDAANFVYNFSNRQLRWNEDGGRLLINSELGPDNGTIFGVELYGSSQSDRFFFRGAPQFQGRSPVFRSNSISQFQVFGLDGDDRFQPQNGFVNYAISGGLGDDLILLDERHVPNSPFSNSAPQIYQIDDSSIRFSPLLTIETPSILISEPVETIRLRGSGQTENRYTIFPSESTRIVVEGPNDEPNQLSIIDPTNTSTLTTFDDNSGIWSVPGKANIVFSGIQTTRSLLVLNEFEIADFIGLDLEQANELAASQGLITRIASQDGISNILTHDYRIDRVNFGIVDNVVVGASIG